MSIVRVGLAETKNFSEGYDAIFGKKRKEAEPEPTAKATKAAKPAKTAKPKKKSTKRK